MAEHYTKNTVSASAFCPKCRRETQHRIDCGRRGPCMVCLERKPVQAEAQPTATQLGLFDLGATARTA